ncbi:MULTISPECIES: sigma-E factor negative regulatory protein [Stenotrophomonas]|uniref:sigma-E factor negative regulatory protein n=1 Tax=Stenotrophomonas TaxID=40323 RepID=UPI00087304C9|nr:MULTISPECIES: sigma-E factor negative regulatory protein [Stenotrophomonas]OEZ00829.1 anti-sigma factor [Stenotrophomonas sp. BIIR7]
MSNQLPDKFDAHHRQQLSALVDGELPLEEARFLLRRLEHDEDLSGCQERWQLLGDVLRGQACAPAPADFADRIQAAVSAEPRPAVVPAAPVARARRSGWLRLGGGAALAASVAAIALFVTREQLPGQTAPDQPTTIIASQAQLPPPTPRAPAAPTAVADAALAVAAVPAAAATARRNSSTRTQQAARGVASRVAEPVRAVASQAPLAPTVPAASARALPFGDVSSLQARPWPRSTLGDNGAINASFRTQQPPAAFYPFEPRLQDDGAD